MGIRYMGVEYSTGEIRDGRFVDGQLEGDFRQARRQLLGSPDRRTLQNEETWKRGGAAARRLFLEGIQQAAEAEAQEELRRKEMDDVQPDGMFAYEGPESRIPSTQFTSLLVREGVEEIPEKAFLNCVDLRSATLPSSLRKIGSHAFENCVSLEGLRLADVEYVGDYAFQNCTSLLAVELGPRVSHVGTSAFRGCLRLRKATIPPNTTFLGDYAFAFCPKLEEAAIMDGVARVPNGLLMNCPELKRVLLPASVQEVGKDAFSGCPQATICVPTLDREEAEELLGCRMTARAEDDPDLYQCDRGYMVKLYKDLF